MTGATKEVGTIATLAAPASAPGRADAQQTDEDLVAAVRAGDDRAFEALWQRYHRRITAYVNGMVNDHARAEDITQDVFVSALRRMRETDRTIAFKPWVYEIAKNACIDAFRRSRRGEEVSYHAEAGLPAADQMRLVSPLPTPDVAVDQRMSLDDLRGAFGGLSKTHHDVLVLRELEGLSYREIGERLGMSRPSVESTLFRARRRLSEEYEELVSGERCRRVQRMIFGASATPLGARDERRMSKHVSHCSGCRREAAMAGFDVAQLAPWRLRQRVAALLPLPAFLRKRLGADDGSAGVATQSAAAQWAASMVGQYVEPAALSGWAKAAAAAATVAVAGVGAGAASDAQHASLGGRDELVSPAAGAGESPAGASLQREVADGRARGPHGGGRQPSSARPSEPKRRPAADAAATSSTFVSESGGSAPQAHESGPSVELRSSGDGVPANGTPATTTAPTPSNGSTPGVLAPQPAPSMPSGATGRVPAPAGGASSPTVSASASVAPVTSTDAAATSATPPGAALPGSAPAARAVQPGTAVEQSSAGTTASLDVR